MGSTGPWKSWIGFGPSTRPVGGMSYLWNFPGEKEPPGSSAILPDHLAGRALAVGALATMLARDRRGCGSHVEVAQVEVVIGLMADLLLKAALEPGGVLPQGNHSERGAPWGVYPCAGTERWCAITVRDDDDWRRLKKALGDPEWARNSAYDTANGRITARAEIDVCLGAWTAARVDREVMEILQRASVPAGLMMYASDMPNDPHLVARGYPQPIEQPGTTKLILEGPA